MSKFLFNFLIYKINKKLLFITQNHEAIYV